LVTLPLVYVSSFFDKHRDVYYDLLFGVSANGDWEDWLRFFCQGVLTQAQDGITRSDLLLKLRERYYSLVTGPRAPSLLREVVDGLFASPATNASVLAEKLRVRPQQAQRYINRLEDKGVLEEVTGNNYGRIYVAREILKLIESDDLDSH